MFDYFNKLFLKNAVDVKKTIMFSHNPTNYDTGFILDEWNYLESRGYTYVISSGGYWIAK